MVFITETECVYCAVRNGCLNTMEVQLGCCSATPASSAHSSRRSSASCCPSLVLLPVLSLWIELAQQSLPVLSALLHQMSDDLFRGSLLFVTAFLTAGLQSIRQSFCNETTAVFKMRITQPVHSISEMEYLFHVQTVHFDQPVLLSIPTAAHRSSIELILTHISGRVTQICVFNTVKLGTSASSP